MQVLLFSSLLCTLAPEGPAEEAVRFLTRCRQGQFEQATGAFDGTIASKLSAEKLKEAWDGIVKACGPLRPVAFGPPRVDERKQVSVVKVRCEFALQALDAQIGVRDGKIIGFTMQPPGPAGPLKPAPYVDAAKFSEREVTVGAEGWPLKGTLTLPKDRAAAPLIVLVHGSGPHDRDESIGPNAPFRDIAQGLATRGVAVLRYDKRTFAHGKKLAADKEHPVTIDSEVIDDALAAVKAARNWPEVDARRVYVLGHSLGGTAAPAIAIRDGHLAGIILMAAAARPPDKMAIDQFTYLRDHDPVQAEAAREYLRTLHPKFERIRNGEARDDEVVFHAPAAYWKSWFALAPAKIAAQLKDLPILILQGKRDYQITEADLDLFKKALAGRDEVTVHLYANFNHIFFPAGPRGTDLDYFDEGHVDAGVVEDIAAWVAKRK